MTDSTRPLFHVTTSERADAIAAEGYRATDWLTRIDEWGLDPTDRSTWDVGEHHTVVAVALAEAILEDERLEGHPPRTPAAFFYSNPWTARKKIRTRDFGNTCVVVDSDMIESPIACAPDSKVGVVFQATRRATKYDRSLDLDQIREWAHKYWLHVNGWGGNTHPYTEVFVSTDRVPAESVVRVIDDESELARVGREGAYKRYNK